MKPGMMMEWASPTTWSQRTDGQDAAGPRDGHAVIDDRPVLVHGDDATAHREVNAL
jgi:hypothetical protein